jgi:hypothetical protein
MASAAGARDFGAVHERLRRVLAPYRDRLSVTKDGPAGMALEVPGLEGKPYGYVAGTRVGKSYVSYYLMPVYAMPDLLDGASRELLKRKQGKACFNFTKVDEALMEELERVTAAGIERFREMAEARAAARP